MKQLYMSRKLTYPFLIFTTGLALRLYPTMLTGLPFSTDSWPQIRNTELLIEKTPIQLGANRVFDGYNIYWPASQVYGAVVSQLIGQPPISAMAIYIPLAGSFTILAFYALLTHLTQNRIVSFVASLLFTVSGTHTIFTAGVTKETFANPLYILALYLFLRNDQSRCRLIAYILILTALVATHHLTTFILLVILTNTTMATLFLSAKGEHSVLKRGTMLLIISLVLTIIYYVIYAAEGMKGVISIADWISASAFQVLTFSAMLYILLRPAPRRLPVAWVSPILLTALIIFVNQYKAILPGAPSLPEQLLIYIYVHLTVGLLSVLGLFFLKQSKMDNNAYPLAMWLSSILALEGYSAFAASAELSLTLIYRLVNFLYPAIAAFAGIGVYKLYKALEIKINHSNAIWLTSFLIIILALISMHQSYAAVIQQENYLGYQWMYQKADYQQALWLKHHKEEGHSVAGDMKIQYLMESYMGMKVDVAKGYAFLTDSSSLGSSILATYPSMIKNGYVIGPYGNPLPDKWIERLNSLSKIYANGYNELYLVSQVP